MEVIYLEIQQTLVTLDLPGLDLRIKRKDTVSVLRD